MRSLKGAEGRWDSRVTIGPAGSLSFDLQLLYYALSHRLIRGFVKLARPGNLMFPKMISAERCFRPDASLQTNEPADFLGCFVHPYSRLPVVGESGGGLHGTGP